MVPENIFLNQGSYYLYTYIFLSHIFVRVCIYYLLVKKNIFLSLFIGVSKINRLM